MAIDLALRSAASGTLDLSDAAFAAAMEECTLGADRFRHYDHLRLAWIFLRAAAIDSATERMLHAIRRFAAHHGAAAKYHETMTRVYMRLVAAHLARTPELDDFAEFAEAHPALFDRRLPFAYYSEASLMSDSARSEWVAPDLRPLPEVGA